MVQERLFFLGVCEILLVFFRIYMHLRIDGLTIKITGDGVLPYLNVCFPCQIKSQFTF